MQKRRWPFWLAAFFSFTEYGGCIILKAIQGPAAAETRKSRFRFSTSERGTRMHGAIQRFIKETAQQFNIGITTYKHLQELEESKALFEGAQMVAAFSERHAAALVKLLRASKSQLHQDLFALAELGMKREGFFVEFGATNGVVLSNTYLLETQFGWKGILAEPAAHWHKALKSNRHCAIETTCVWRESNAILEFNEVASEKELSTLSALNSSDIHAQERKKGRTYPVKTISLADLLDKFDAPKIVDYLSIDTEGSEYEILSAFDFARHQFRVITCEHNFTPQREKIHALLTAHGYVRKFEQFSQCDDWYVLAEAN
jgi:FkbM family methyltransferase